MAVRMLAAFALAFFAGGSAAGSFCDGPPTPEFASLKAVDVGNDWFKVYAVAPGVFAINEPRQEEQVTSFLVVGSKRAVLFDSGMGIGRISDVVKKLTPMPVTVLNSHTHFDHVGGNHEFADVRNLDEPFSQASARGEVSEALRDYAKDSLSEDRVCGALPTGVARGEYAMPTWQVSSSVRDGELLDLGDRMLEVLYTPGHTPDSMCLLDAANGLLLTGDTYYSGEVFLWAPETDVARYESSIERLAGLAPGLKLLLPAHGPPVAEPSQLIDLQKALRDIDAGVVPFETTPRGRLLYKFEHFSILTSAPGK
jgi:glyoxylase-like metal-dependent hydrolase (beta-lactamase superfamily II)